MSHVSRAVVGVWGRFLAWLKRLTRAIVLLLEGQIGPSSRSFHKYGDALLFSTMEEFPSRYKEQNEEKVLVLSSWLCLHMLVRFFEPQIFPIIKEILQKMYPKLTLKYSNKSLCLSNILLSHFLIIWPSASFKGFVCNIQDHRTVSWLFLFPEDCYFSPVLWLYIIASL